MSLTVADFISLLKTFPQDAIMTYDALDSFNGLRLVKTELKSKDVAVTYAIREYDCDFQKYHTREFKSQEERDSTFERLEEEVDGAEKIITVSLSMSQPSTSITLDETIAKIKKIMSNLDPEEEKYKIYEEMLNNLQ